MQNSLVLLGAVAVVWLLVAHEDVASAGELSSLCSRCSGSVSNGSIVEEKCQRNNGSVQERCCLKRNCDSCSAVVVGLDWSRCNLTSLEDYTFSSIGGSLMWLDLSANHLSNETMASRTLGGLVNLTTLALPSGFNCSDSAWNTSMATASATVCSHPLWPCGWPFISRHIQGHPNETEMFNITGFELCPVHSNCSPDGPGLHQCLCRPGYYGYKCLLQGGEFPYVAFFTSSVGGALGIIVIYWLVRLIERYVSR